MGFNIGLFDLQFPPSRGPGVYDLAWLASNAALVCACADGTLRYYPWDAEVAEVCKLCDGILTHVCWGAGEALDKGAWGRVIQDISFFLI